MRLFYNYIIAYVICLHPWGKEQIKALNVSFISRMSATQTITKVHIFHVMNVTLFILWIMDEPVQTCAALSGMACNQSCSDRPLLQTVISAYSVSGLSRETLTNCDGAISPADITCVQITFLFIASNLGKLWRYYHRWWWWFKDRGDRD